MVDCVIPAPQNLCTVLEKKEQLDVPVAVSWMYIVKGYETEQHRLGERSECPSLVDQSTQRLVDFINNCTSPDESQLFNISRFEKSSELFKASVACVCRCVWASPAERARPSAHL